MRILKFWEVLCHLTGGFVPQHFERQCAPTPIPICLSPYPLQRTHWRVCVILPSPNQRTQYKMRAPLFSEVLCHLIRGLVLLNSGRHCSSSHSVFPIRDRVSLSSGRPCAPQKQRGVLIRGFLPPYWGTCAPKFWEVLSPPLQHHHLPFQRTCVLVF